MKINEITGIKVNTLTLEDFFKKNIFYIPKYQRDYSWNHSNVKTFIEDILENSKYYIGNVMTRLEMSKLDIIDGQQRIVTSFLIFIIVKELNIRKKLEIEFDNQLLSNDSELRLQIQDRIADKYINIIKYLYDNADISDSLIESNEYVQFKFINTFLNKFTNESIIQLYENLKNCQVVNIDTTNSSIKANKMFLNLNTKGMKLSNTDIVKSIIFSFFENTPDYGSYKNQWYDAFNSLSSNEKDDYLSIYLSIYITTKTTRISKTSIVDEYEKILTNSEMTKKVFNDLASYNSIYNAAYKAVVNGDSNKYEKLFETSSARLSNLFRYQQFIKKINFIQFNIALISMLTYEPKKNNKVSKNLIKYIDFVQLIFLFSCYLGLQDTSPSSYSNDFIKLAVNMRNKENISENIKKILGNFKNMKLLKLEDLDFFDKIEVKSGQKSMKYFVALITYLDDDKTCDYTGEHIYPESGNNQNRYSFANIIPVINDIYGSKEYRIKIAEYKENINSEIHIKKFLESDFKNDFSDFIEDRKLRYKNLFIQKFNELFSKLTK